MKFHGAFKHTECAGMFCFQFINCEHELTTSAVLVVEHISKLHEAAGGNHCNTWNVHLPVLEWGDGKKITSFEGNDIFNSILVKMEEKKNTL